MHLVLVEPLRLISVVHLRLPDGCYSAKKEKCVVMKCGCRELC